jgi:secondary thiamine-phosphate synthase enzyme
MSRTQTLSVRTKQRTQFVDITSDVQDAVRSSGMQNGLCVVYVPHTTAGITINEHAAPSVARDIESTLDKLVPAGAGYSHMEGNADSHIKSSMMGSSVTVIVEEGRLQLGTWQGVFFCEFDGPRSRRCMVYAHGDA